MSQTCELETRPIPARRRALAPLPVLISIPNLAADASRTPHVRVRRRRLRREIRVVGYALLVILPLSMAFATLGAEIFRPMSSRLIFDPMKAPAESSPGQAPSIQLAPLEPVIAAPGERDHSISFTGYLLPADATQESTDGGH